jgi:hypothetical protein
MEQTAVSHGIMVNVKGPVPSLIPIFEWLRGACVAFDVDFGAERV